MTDAPVETVLDSVVESTDGITYRRQRAGEQTLLDASDEVEALTGCAADTLADRGWLDAVAPDDRAALRDAVAGAAPGECVEETYRIRRTDGTSRRVRDRMTVSRDDSSVLEGFVVDVTDRRIDAEDGTASTTAATDSVAQAQRDAALLDAIFERIPVHLYVKDGDAVHQRVSEHLDRSEAYVGKTDLEIDEVADKHARQAYEDDLQVIQNGASVLDKEEHLPLLEQWNLTSKVPLRDGGEVTGLVGVTREITERKRTQRELRRKTERLEEFADVVTHDIRTPLTAARDHLRSLEQAEDPDGAAVDEHLSAITDAIERASDIVDDVLALSRYGRGEIDPESVSLAALAEQAWEVVGTPEATLERPDGDAVIRADRAQLRQLLESLLSNAVEHGGDGTAVAVEILDGQAAGSDRQANSAGGFAVVDDGPGIPCGEREHVFEPAYTTREDGTGFGLAIVEEIADAHGWSVSVGEGDAGGTRIEVTGIEHAAEDHPDADA
ncbi:PAS domain S-box-containing protein [Natronoarchaeum philippinense]|uniref:histidine kinase n=1 Tax=Natronoarchaeum philippinense TaxID=558529 RepID=A0A285PE27_NATPI|nr:ATP-binding protein [Natronoarchaeum philippinense]SNZ18121.1 PAS domain S-box-containing protein [Natronoarchaeum philippinense]